MVVSRIRLPLLLLLGVLAGTGCRGEEGQPLDARTSLGSLDPGYVGNEACFACHGEIVESYAETNHGASLTAFRSDEAPERLPAEGESPPASSGLDDWVHSPVDGLWYRAELQAGRLVQREVLPGAASTPVHDLAVEADRVIGSGNQTRSYLMVREGRVTQMPLTWYVAQEEWDMSPGYAEGNDRFGRPINLQCLSCHGDLPVLEPHTQNVYRQVPEAISCERCHGPAGQHVERRAAGDAPPEGEGDPWIVDPTDLERARELSVCAQCHLAGIIRYPDGQDPTIFRPGMELAENRAVFVPELQLTDPDWMGIDSHPIRLARSACYQASEMTCSTCHRPHTSGAALEEGHYRNRCVACHGGEQQSDRPEPASSVSGEDPRICSRPGVASPAEAMSGDCVACHMSAGGTSDVPHVRFTDHWIRRRPGPPLRPEAGRPAIESPTTLPLVEVSSLGDRISPELLRHRSEGLQASLRADAVFHFYETMHRHPGYLPEVVSAGRAAEESGGPGAPTGEGRLALARALLQLDSVAAAETVLSEAIDVRPDDPWGYVLLGALLQERRNRADEAIRLLRHALELQPQLTEARVELAEALHAAGERDAAMAELERVVGDEPLNQPRSWFNLGILRAEADDLAGAEEAFREAARTDPIGGADARVQLGSLLMARGDLVGAEAHFREAVAVDDSLASAHGSLALVHLERGEIEEARARLERVLELDPDNGPARNLLEQIGSGT